MKIIRLLCVLFTVLVIFFGLLVSAGQSTIKEVERFKNAVFLPHAGLG